MTINWNYFWQTPSDEFNIGYFLLLFFIFLLILPRLIKSIASKNKYLKKSLKKKLWPQILFGITGIFLIFARLSNNPDDFLNKRIWLYLLFILWFLVSSYLFRKIFLAYKKRKFSVKRELNKKSNS